MSVPFETCYRHADRRAGVRCQRCDRPICPDCMIAASVGFQCPQCARATPQRVMRPSARWSRGGQLERPLVTISLIVINVAVFVYDLGRPIRLDGALFGRGFSVVSGGPAGVAEGDWWRLVTAGFLHGGLIHLAFNMVALWSLGQLLEPVLGRLRFGLLYFSSLLAGSFGVLLLNPNERTVGASGAVFGLFGALLILQLSRGISPWDSGLGTILVLNLAITFIVPNISIGGHLGGLVGGALAGIGLFGVPRGRAGPAGSAGRGAVAAAGVVVLVAIGVLCFLGGLWAAGQPGLLT
jgi:membrane associated rhomboid family serine protease